VGKLTGVPVLMDMAEDYPAMLQSGWDHDGRQSIDLLVRNPRLLAALERWIVPRLDGIAVVSEASAERVRKLLRGADVPVTVIGNTPRLDLHATPVESELAQTVAGLSGIKLLYVGFVTMARGISVVIEAVKQVRSQGIDVSLVVVGDGIGLPALEEQAVAAGLENNALFPGWLDQAYVPAVIAAADVCIVPHFVDPHVETTLPNKIYDYMLQGKPVLVTHSKALREIVEQNACGLSYHATDVNELSDAIISLQDEQLREALGASGRSAVLERLNWPNDAQRLNAFVDQLLTSG
jgi:glycosyltransferase involved in cell wall biosynthesis